MVVAIEIVSLPTVVPEMPSAEWALVSGLPLRPIFTHRGAVIPGVSVIEGAAVGAAIGGLAGAVWADNDRDGYADGYVQNGTYYSGTPSGYDPTLRRVATGAIGGAALGAVAGAVIPGLSPITGAVIGAAVGGLAGAVWADNDRDGQADGYVYNGQYYQGQPSGYAPTSAPPPMAGERG